MKKFKLKHLFAFFIIFSFFSLKCYSAALQNPMDGFQWSSLSQKAIEEWKALYHYQKSFFGKFIGQTVGLERSEISDSHFFLSKEGDHHPEAEWNAFIKELFRERDLKRTPEANNQDVFCRFPNRVQFVKRFFPDEFENFKHRFEWIRCSAYENYKIKIQSQKVSIVFSSYHLGSASSAFGHSFFKFSGDNENELFDTGINFSATPTTENPILYAIYGLIGVFPASFSAQSFYYKVREYNDYESRDLWSYELNLSESEREALKDHLWELSSTFFQYYYFNENCSYQLLRAIEAVTPRVRFFDYRPLYLIPSSSIKSLANQKKNFIKSIQYRPSIRSIAFERFKKASDEEKIKIIQSLEESRLEPLDLGHSDEQSRIRMLDSLLDAVDLEESQRHYKSSDPEKEWKNKVREARSKERSEKDVFKVNSPLLESPHQGHGSGRVDLSYHQKELFKNSVKNQNSILNLSMRASHHDLLDPSVGYPSGLHLDFGKIGVNLQKSDMNSNKTKIQISHWTLFDLTALTVDHPLYHKLSYSASIGYQRSVFLTCKDPLNCPIYEMKFGLGKAYSLGRDHLFYFLMDAVPRYSSAFERSLIQFGIEPHANVLLQLRPDFKVLTECRGKLSLGSKTNAGFSIYSEWRKTFFAEKEHAFGLGFETHFEKSFMQTKPYVIQWGLKGVTYF